MESDKNNNFSYIKGDVISKIKDIVFNKKENYIKFDFSTTYNKNYSLISKLTDFKKWVNERSEEEKKSKNLFHNYLVKFFDNSEEAEQLDEIIDDTNEIMPDQDMPSNATNRMVGSDQTMDLEKIFKKSMPKSIRNYSGNLGLGTVVW